MLLRIVEELFKIKQIQSLKPHVGCSVPIKQDGRRPHAGGRPEAREATAAWAERDRMLLTPDRLAQRPGAAWGSAGTQLERRLSQSFGSR